MAAIDTDAIIAALADEGSWRLWDAPLTAEPTSAEYAADLVSARERSGRDESVTSGSARVEDQPVAVIAGDFAFLAGSIGRASAARIIAAFDRATALGLPMLGLPASGGTRMQEGTPAFLLMPAIAAAVARHRAAGLPYLVFVRHPTTGGVFATWGSLGDVVHAQPGALVAFLGPRVYAGLTGTPFPDGVQTAEGLTAAGVIDGVADVTEWRALAARMLRTWRARSVQPVGDPSSGPAGPQPAPAGWGAVLATRDPGRPGVRAVLDLAEDWIPLSGTHEGERAAATLLGLVTIGGFGCVLVGQDRAAQADGRRVGPTDLRVARRGFRLAERWGLPLVTVVDTQGAELSPEAESGGLASEIGRCLAELAVLRTPTLALLLGGGAGGAALALLPADRVVAAADAWITPLPPEGAAVIRYRSTDRTAEVADAQHITVADLRRMGAVDRIVPSPARDPAAIVEAVAEELARLSDGSVDPGSRADRWASIGPPGE